VSESRFTRRIALAAILVVFAGYLVLAHRYRAWYQVPGYVDRQVDILDGATRTQWGKPRYASQRHERLIGLEKQRLQPYAPARISEERTVMPNEALTAEDYAALVSRGKRHIRVADPREIFAFVDRDLRLRAPLTLTVERRWPDGRKYTRRHAYPAGAEVTKELVDDVLVAAARGEHTRRIAVVGSGAVVGFNATVFLVILVFVGMTLVLMEVFWDPVTAWVDRRNANLEQGTRIARANREESERIAAEHAECMRELRAEYIQRMRAARHETMVEADEILTKAHGELKTLRETAERDLKGALRDAQDRLRAQVPELAEAAARAALAGGNSHGE